MPRTRVQSSELGSSYHRRRTLSEDGTPHSPAKIAKKFTEKIHIRRAVSEDSTPLGPAKRSAGPKEPNSKEPEARLKQTFSDQITLAPSEESNKKSEGHRGKEDCADERHRHHSLQRSRSSLNVAHGILDHTKAAKETATLKNKPSQEQKSQREPSLKPRHRHSEGDTPPMCPQRSRTLSPNKGRLPKQSGRTQTNARKQKPSSKVIQRYPTLKQVRSFSSNEGAVAEPPQRDNESRPRNELARKLTPMVSCHSMTSRRRCRETKVERGLARGSRR